MVATLNTPSNPLFGIVSKIILAWYWRIHNGLLVMARLLIFGWTIGWEFHWLILSTFLLVSIKTCLQKSDFVKDGSWNFHENVNTVFPGLIAHVSVVILPLVQPADEFI